MVITFKHKLKLVLKDDIYQRNVYEKSVKSIHKFCIDSDGWLRGSLSFNTITIGKFVAMVEVLTTLVDVYVGNKFSPASAGLLHPRIDDMRKHVSNIIDIFQMIIDVNDKLNKQTDSMTDQNDIDELQELYNEHCKKVNRQLDVEIDILLSILQYIDGFVSCDLVKINMGVNPITEYRKRLKRLPKNEDMMSEFHIQFKALTKSDREFLEKERIKNERK